ncbi:MAG TPA: hypothetical protein VE029_14775 [Rhizobacter sp.]|nr:hypothetical protein [Rhizobacter sp.]
MSEMDNDGRFAPPRAVVEDVAEPSDQPTRAGRGGRFCAVLIDARFIFSPSRRCIHDHLADALVIQA